MFSFETDIFDTYLSIIISPFQISAFHFETLTIFRWGQKVIPTTRMSLWSMQALQIVQKDLKIFPEG